MRNTRWRTTAVAAALLGASVACGVGAALPARAKEPVTAQRRARFLCMGVLEGLLEDNVPDDVVASVLEKADKDGYRNFVYGCPVCAPVIEAFRCYAMRVEPGGWYYQNKGDPYAANPGGTVLPADLLAGLRAGKREERLAAMEGLVARYVQRRFEMQRFSAEERNAMQEAMKLGRKEGMGFLKSSDGREKDRTGMGTCPSCDGANDWGGVGPVAK